MSKLLIGEITKPQGLKGEMKVYPYADNSFFEGLKEVYIDDNDVKTTLLNCSVKNNGIFIKVGGVDTIEKAEMMRGIKLYLDRKDVDAGDSFLIDDLIGLTVMTDDGQNYGEIQYIEKYGSADIVTINGQFGKWQFPYIWDLVLNVDLGNKIMTISKKRFDEVKV